VTTADAGLLLRADFNCDGTVDNRDVADLTAYVFRQGPNPCPKE
jgi:hypothetical protein